MTVNSELLDSAVRHSIDLTRYGNSVVRKIISLLNKSDADIVAKLTALDEDTLTAKRLEKLLTELRVINRDAYNLVGKELTKELAGLADYEAGFQVRSIKSALPIEISVIQPTAEQVRAATMARPFQGRYLREWMSGLEEAAGAKVRDAIRIGFTEGETIGQMARRLRGTKARGYTDGVVQISRRNAEGVVRTAVNHTSNVARQETYRQNADLVKTWRYVSTLDGRTSATCRTLDGQVFEIGKGPQPPQHINCRSTSIPITASWKELGFDLDELPPSTRASMNGQIPATETYGDWLKKQPASFQDDVLGDTKGKLFRDGGLTVDKFTDSKYQEYTISELRKREGSAFERAGL